MTRVLDLLWSTIFYCGSIAVLIGLLAIVRPLPRLGLRKRRRALMVVVAGFSAITIVFNLTPPTRAAAAPSTRLDDLAPRFQFREAHEIRVAAPPERAYAAIKTVTANEIALFQTFTWIRRFGQDGPESIMNAPGNQPILDVAVKGGFTLLADEAPREIVFGTPVTGARSLRDDPRAVFQIAMNFLVVPDGPAASRIVTETRVFANTPSAVGQFTRYWRVIYPGSAILRVTWLRAVKVRAERPSS